MRFFQKEAGVGVKICGVRSGQQLETLVEIGVDAVGINFWRGSKRFVEPGEANQWLGGAAGAVARIGLFVNASFEEVESVVDLGVLDAIQLHGEESDSFTEEVIAFGLPVLRAVGVTEEGPSRNLETCGTPYFLFDVHDPKAKGGTGKTFRWEHFRQAAADHPDAFLILAGGLHPGNVAEAVSENRPHAVDTASGVEREPGVKDLELVRAFVEQVRAGQSS